MYVLLSLLFSRNGYSALQFSCGFSYTRHSVPFFLKHCFNGIVYLKICTFTHILLLGSNVALAANVAESTASLVFQRWFVDRWALTMVFLSAVGPLVTTSGLPA